MPKKPEVIENILNTIVSPVVLYKVSTNFYKINFN